MQASVNRPGLLPLVKQLLEHPAFSLKNPNKVRSVIGSFVQNAINFHDYSGSGYCWLADILLQLDGINPQMAGTSCNSSWALEEAHKGSSKTYETTVTTTDRSAIKQ